MRQFVYSKLVRNKILDDMLNNGQQPRYYILDDHRYLIELQRKILEEAKEINLDDPGKLLDELSDIQEVIDCMVAAINESSASLKAAQASKNAKAGSFDRRVYIDTVATPDDNPWIPYLEKNSDRYPEFDIYKAAGIIIKDRQLLVERSHGKDVFVAPGGKLEADETPKQALVRELKEEFQLTVAEEDLEEFGVFYADAAGSHNVGKRLRMDVFIVNNVTGDITADSEVEEIRWITSAPDPDIEVGSIFLTQVLPQLKAQGLVD